MYSSVRVYVVGLSQRDILDQMMCPFRLIMLFFCSIGSIAGTYMIFSTDSMLPYGIKNTYQSPILPLPIKVIKVLVVAVLVAIHADVFLQLGYTKAFVHAALDIPT